LLDFRVEEVLLAQKRSVPFVNNFPDVFDQLVIEVNQLRDLNCKASGSGLVDLVQDLMLSDSEPGSNGGNVVFQEVVQFIEAVQPLGHLLFDVFVQMVAVKIFLF
jgi:hypothetical protein